MGRAARWVRSLLGGKKEQRVASGDGGGGGEEKKRWSFGRSWRERGDGPAAKVVVENVWRRDYYLESEKEQSRHAIAVAAATAAAADAAVAAAQAAVAVVKLTSHGRRRRVAFGGGKEEDGAALKIQCVFRGYLARKALLALKALVKLQALVRGHIVRKQVVMNIHKMQALNRAKSRVRSRRSCPLPIKDHTRFNPESKHRRSLEKSDESKSEQHSSSFHGRRLSATPTDASQPQSQSLSGFDDSPRIVEIDPGRPKSRNRRFKQSSELQDKSYMLLHSHLPSSWNVQECCDECQSSTAQSTPRLLLSSLETCGATPVTPRRSGWNALDSPNYMAKTQSFKAKVRSQSAPKLRSEPGRRDSTMETVEPTAGVTSVGTRRSCSQAREGVGFKNDTVSA